MQIESPKYKAVFLVHYFYPHIGGVEKHSLNLALQLIKLGYQITIVTSQYNKNLKKREIYQGIKIIRISLSNRDWDKPSKLQLWKWMIQHRKIFDQTDIVHCHDVFFWYLPLRFLLPRKPVFITFHGYEGRYPILKKAIFIRKLSEKLSYGNICVGKFIEIWYGTQSDLITYGAISPPEKRELGSVTIKNIDKLKILYLGRLSKDTGLHIYLQSFKLLKEKHPKLKITFLGDGPLKKQCQKYGRVLGFQQNISAQLDKHQFIFTSGYLSILESMAHHRPAFSVYQNPLKKDYLELTPFKNYINIASNPVQLDEQIEYYINNPKKTKQKTTQAFKYSQTQTWEKLTKDYLKLWKRAIPT